MDTKITAVNTLVTNLDDELLHVTTGKLTLTKVDVQKNKDDIAALSGGSGTTVTTTTLPGLITTHLSTNNFKPVPAT